MARNVQVVTGPAYAPQDRIEAFANAMAGRALRSRAPQQGGPVQVAMNPWEGVAQLGEAGIAALLSRKSQKLAEADHARKLAANDQMIRQLAGTKTEDRAPMATYGQQAPNEDRIGALSAAMAGMDPGAANQVLSGQVLQNTFAKPTYKEIDRGDRIDIVDENYRVVQSMPKGATPDAQLREGGENRRYYDVSGNTQATVGAQMRGQDIGASTARRGQDITARGQDLTYDASLRGHQATASNRDLQQQRFDMDKEKYDRERRAAALDQQAKADDVLKMQGNVQGLLDAPGFNTIYGKSRFMSPSMLPGGEGADAEARRNQLEAASFGISIQQMKGLGALSNAEGLKVTAAYTRAVDPKQSEEAAREAWAEVQGYLKMAQDRIASGGLVTPSAPAPAATGIDAYMQKYGGQQ